MKGGSVTMANNISKKFLAGFLALSAGFVLASCDPISAVPKNYTDPILTGDKLDVDSNMIGTLYDAVATEKNSKVVEKILKEIAESRFGTFAEFKAARDDASKIADFTNQHKDYFGTGSTATRRFNQFKDDVAARINEFFYNEVSNVDYQNEIGKFSEEKLYNKKRYELYDLDKEPSGTFSLFFVDNQIDKTNAFDKLSQKAQYEKTTDRGYIKEKVYPDILKDKLVEDYIYRTNYNSLGRAYGREINMIKLPYEGSSPFTKELAENFARSQIEALPFSEETAKIGFEHLANAYKGFAPSTNAAYLIDSLSATEESFFTGIETQPTIEIDFGVDDEDDYTYENIVLVREAEYHVETKLGKVLKSYKDAVEGEKAGRFPTPAQKSALESFTGEGKSKEHGLFDKIVEIMKEDYTTQGWFVKSSGVSDLPSALKDRLFNIRVANDIDDPKALLNETDASTLNKWMYERTYDDAGNVTDIDESSPLTRLPYLRKIQGRKVVIPAKPDWKTKEQNYVYDDENSISICQVLEAPSTAKLNLDKTTVYDAATKERLARSIGKVLGTKDSYIKDAYTEYLNKYDFAFFDSSLYDYLKSEYPDLDIFDED